MEMTWKWSLKRIAKRAERSGKTLFRAARASARRDYRIRLRVVWLLLLTALGSPTFAQPPIEHAKALFAQSPFVNTPFIKTSFAQAPFAQAPFVKQAPRAFTWWNDRLHFTGPVNTMSNNRSWLYYYQAKARSLDHNREMLFKQFTTATIEDLFESNGGRPGPGMEYLIFDERPSKVYTGVHNYYTVEQWNRGVEKYETFRNASIVVGAACVIVVLLYISFKIYNLCTHDQNTQDTPERYIPQETRSVESFVPNPLELGRSRNHF